MGGRGGKAPPPPTSEPPSSPPWNSLWTFASATAASWNWPCATTPLPTSAAGGRGTMRGGGVSGAAAPNPVPAPPPLTRVATPPPARRPPEQGGGELAKQRARLVNETALAHLGRRLHLGTFLLLGKGEEKGGGGGRAGLLAA